MRVVKHWSAFEAQIKLTWREREGLNLVKRVFFCFVVSLSEIVYCFMAYLSHGKNLVTIFLLWENCHMVSRTMGPILHPAQLT